MSTTTPMSLKKGLTLSILYTLIVLLYILGMFALSTIISPLIVFLNGGVILMVAIWKFVNYYDR